MRPVFTSAMRIRVLRLSSAARRGRERRLDLACHARTARRAPPRVHVAFQLPYRTRFGQRIALLGSGLLGEWDTRQAVPMTWSEGDIWKADLTTTDLVPGDIIRYKYVICNADGIVEEWKPGEDFTLRVPSAVEDADQAQLHIVDTWDGAVHEVAIETMTEKREKGGGEASLQPSAETFMLSALKSSYEDLEVKLNAAQSLLEVTSDPGAKEMVLADRELAIAANKASALTKVVEAASQAEELRQHKHGSKNSNL